MVAADAGLATLVRPQEEETPAPWSNRGLPILPGLRPDPAMLWVAVCRFMKLANSWPGACSSLQAEGRRAENIRASDPSVDRTCVATLGRGANARAAGQQRLARTRQRAVVWLLASAIAALGSADAFAVPRHKHVPAHPSKVAEAKHHKHGSASDAKRSVAARQSKRDHPSRAEVPTVPLPIARPAAASLPPDLAATKQAIELVRQGKPSEATLIAASIGDPGGAEARRMDAAAPP